MFVPTTDKIARITKYLVEREATSSTVPSIIQELDVRFSIPTNVYVDYANIARWQGKGGLGWFFDLRRLRQFLRSFDGIRSLKLYYGTLAGNAKSEQLLKEAADAGFEIITKPVKIMRHSIEATSVPPTSPALLRPFMRPAFLHRLPEEIIKAMNAALGALNQKGVHFIEDRKCNFDVEIGRDMLLDFHLKRAQGFALWSGDSDFDDPVRQLVTDGQHVSIFGTVRKVSRELSLSGARIFETQKIRSFICANRDLPVDVRNALTQKYS